jgi:hypothetical protein
LVCFLAIVQFLRSEDDLQLGIVHGRFPFVACFPRSWNLGPRTCRKPDFLGGWTRSRRHASAAQFTQWRFFIN